jgi:hypothetical protein
MVLLPATVAHSLPSLLLSFDTAPPETEEDRDGFLTIVNLFTLSSNT